MPPKHPKIATLERHLRMDLGWRLRWSARAPAFGLLTFLGGSLAKAFGYKVIPRSWVLGASAKNC